MRLICRVSLCLFIMLTQMYSTDLEKGFGLSKTSSRTSLLTASARVGVNSDMRDVASEPVAMNGNILTWVQSSLFTPPPASNNCMFAGEVFSGTARGAVFFKLGFDLGERALSKINEPITQGILASIYGLGVFIPMAVLGTKGTSGSLRKLLAKKSQLERDIELRTGDEDKCCTAGGTFKGAALTGGLISAPPVTYLTYLKLNGIISWFWIVPAVPTFYVRTAIDYYSITTLANMLRDGIRTPIYRYISLSSAPDSRESLITRLRDHLTYTRAFIAALNYPQAKALVEELGRQQTVPDKVALISHPETFIKESVDAQEVGWLREGFAWLGGGVGGYGMWIYFPVARESFKPVLGLFGLGLEECDPLLDVLASISIGTASSLSTLATYSSTHKFANVLSGLWSRMTSSDEEEENQASLVAQQETPEEGDAKADEGEAEEDIILKNKRIRAAIIAAVAAACNASMQAEVAIEFLDLDQTGPRLELAAGIIASFSTCFWAVDEVLLGYLKAGDPRTGLLAKIDKVMGSLFVMSDESLRSLTNLFRPTNSF